MIHEQQFTGQFRHADGRRWRVTARVFSCSRCSVPPLTAEDGALALGFAGFCLLRLVGRA